MSHIHSIGHDIWDYEIDVALPLGLRMPSRTTIVRLASGALVVHAPLAFDDAAAKELEALGDVRFVIAPACTHWLFVKAFRERWPRATVFAAPGLEKKLTGKHGVSFEPLPPTGRVEAIGDELRVQRIDGAPGMDEHVFLHRGSRSLVVTDLLFNIHTCSSLGMRLFLALTGVWGKPAQSRAWRFLVKDRAQAAQSVAGILGWEFERVIAAHGAVIDANARQQMAGALRWMTQGAPPLLGTGGVVV